MCLCLKHVDIPDKYHELSTAVSSVLYTQRHVPLIPLLVLIKRKAYLKNQMQKPALFLTSSNLCLMWPGENKWSLWINHCSWNGFWECHLRSEITGTCLLSSVEVEYVSFMQVLLCIWAGYRAWQNSEISLKRIKIPDHFFPGWGWFEKL